MARTYKLNQQKNTGLYLIYGLVFFLLVTLAACNSQDKKLRLLWKDHRATGIEIPRHLVKDGEAGLKVVLDNNKTSQGMLGNFVRTGDVIVFEPLIPLSPGLMYDVLADDKLIGKISVPLDTGEPAPELLSIYPGKDTLPENLLKFYFRFSKPMRTGQSLNYISLLDEHNDTMRNVFLNLQPELWDTTGTVLTLWLDPGRIKRGLVLNRKLGNPLKKAETYKLVISQKWKDDGGLNLSKDYSKLFVAGERNEHVPDIDAWQLNIPKAGTVAPLVIDTREPLDHYLLQESISVLDGKGSVVRGTSNVIGTDQVWKFTPAAPWKTQHYKLQVKARLEDLCGNNLNRVFDRDITKDLKKDKEYYERSFEATP